MKWSGDNTKLMMNEMEKRQQLSSEGKEACQFVEANVCQQFKPFLTGWHTVFVYACAC